MKIYPIVLASIILASCSSKGAAKPEQEAKTSAPPLTQEQIETNLKEASTPAANHAVLKKLTGNWNAETKFWVDPAGQPEVSKGKAVNKMILGDRYLSSSFKGKAMGKPFEGQSVIGYDNVSKKYFSTWIDTMNTGLFKSEGTANQDNTEITLNSSFTCPMTREPLQSEEKLTIIDKNHYKYEAFMVGGGKHDKAMEISYTRSR